MKWVVVGILALIIIIRTRFERFYKMNLDFRRDFDYHFRLFVRHGFVASDRRNRLVVESDFGNDGGDACF
jgi:hypothetical protein